MVKLATILSHNAALKSQLSPNLIAVFVGGTSGISLSTAQALARHTPSPKIYLVGRSQTAAETAIASIKTINPSASAVFLQSDISVLKNVDAVCDEIAAREKKLNLLFMTPGVLTLKGRDETSEGLDRKMALHYYARMRFIHNLLPLLSLAAEEKRELSRVISVLDPHVSIRVGGDGKLDHDDLSLKQSFSLNKCGKHASLMGNFCLEGMARGNPRTGFVHAYPSGVATGVMRGLPFSNILSPLVTFLLGPFLVPLGESGERHLFVATDERFAARGQEAEGAVVGSDGVRGSGCYWVNWDGEALAESEKLKRTREGGAVERVVRHTEEVFERVCVEGATYP